MRPEIYDTFRIYSPEQTEKSPRITLGEIKEFTIFFAGLAKETINASREVAKRDGLKGVLKEFKLLKIWIQENL